MNSPLRGISEWGSNLRHAFAEALCAERTEVAFEVQYGGGASDIHFCECECSCAEEVESADICRHCAQGIHTDDDAA